MLKMPMLLLKDRRRAGDELENSLKSYLQIQNRGFRALENAKMNEPENEYIVLLFI